MVPHAIEVPSWVDQGSGLEKGKHPGKSILSSEKKAYRLTHSFTMMHDSVQNTEMRVQWQDLHRNLISNLFQGQLIVRVDDCIVLWSDTRGVVAQTREDKVSRFGCFAPSTDVELVDEVIQVAVPVRIGLDVAFVEVDEVPKIHQLEFADELRGFAVESLMDGNQRLPVE